MPAVSTSKQGITSLFTISSKVTILPIISEKPTLFSIFKILNLSPFSILISASSTNSDVFIVSSIVLRVFLFTFTIPFNLCPYSDSPFEITDMSIYISMLNKYRQENYKGPENTTYGFNVEDIHAGETVPQINEDGEVEKSLDDLLSELNGLIGLEIVKKDVNSLIHLQEIKRLRKSRGLKEIPVSNHLVFYGNPGTGKTTVARLLAKIYHKMGILSQGQFVEVDRSGLVAGYVGKSPLKIQEVVKSALGGVLFIDEAYTLTYSDSGNDYGQEAVDTLLKAMEDNRDDLIVIVAGYPAPMEEFLNSNPGLKSRFNKYLYFEDYTPDELIGILKLNAKKADLVLSEEAEKFAKEFFTKRCENRPANYANGRDVRNFFEKATDFEKTFRIKRKLWNFIKKII